MSDESSRMDRTLETRDEGARERSWQRPSALPTPEPKNGYGYRWVRMSTYGADDVSNMSSKLREGWEPVTYAEVPELGVLDRKGRERSRVEIGGLVLCRMPTEMIRQRDAYYRRQSELALEAADNSYLRDGGDDQRMKKHIERRSETKSFG